MILIRKSTDETGWIPKSYAAPASSLEIKEWYFKDIDRDVAELYLQMASTGKGTFLVRPSFKINQRFTLSLKHEDEQGNTTITHFKIKANEHGHLFIQDAMLFYSLPDLIQAYKGSEYCLPTKLLHSCPKDRPVLREINRDNLDHVELQRSKIQYREKTSDTEWCEIWYGQYEGEIDINIKELKHGARNQNEFLREAKTLKNLCHDNIVIFYGVCSEQEPLLIITEYMDQHNLKALLHHQYYRSYLEVTHLLECAIQVAKGMEYLEKNNLVHRNLAACNVLVKAGLKCKIGNFDLTCNETYHTEGMIGDFFLLKWMAPESLTSNKFTNKSDVYSFSIVMYEIFTYGCNPYPDIDPYDLAGTLAHGYRMSRPTTFDIPDKIFEIMCSAWHPDPDQRPNFEDLVLLLEAIRKE
ncbi:tyrosine-protein kinase Fyn-like isoform X2 [Oratosquilla oratoria]